jgi:hypothetical protein
MIWATLIILIVAFGLQNRMISQLEKDNDWLNFQMAFLEERIIRVEGEKDGTTSLSEYESE